MTQAVSQSSHFFLILIRVTFNFLGRLMLLHFTDELSESCLCYCAWKSKFHELFHSCRM